MNRIILTIFMLVSTLPVFSQRAKSNTAVQTATFNAELFQGLKWRNIGPFRGGRSGAVSGVIHNDQVYFVHGF